MPTLRQLLDKHRTILLIDSASARVQVAILRDGRPPLWKTATGEAGENVFACVENAIGAAGLTLDAIAAFLFCDGPGSVLGVRTAAVALRMWCVLRPRPVYRYGSLSLLAHALARQGRQAFSVIADARRDTWHHIAVDEAGNVSPLCRMPTRDLTGALLMPEGFRHWTELPKPAESVPYSLERLLPHVEDVDLWQATAEPDAFLHEEPVYQKWTPQVHRAP